MIAYWLVSTVIKQSASGIRNWLVGQVTRLTVYCNIISKIGEPEARMYTYMCVLLGSYICMYCLPLRYVCIVYLVCMYCRLVCMY